MSDETKGASNNERLLAAAKQDDLDLILEVFGAGDFDINFQDGLGNTALHYAASLGCPEALEEILSYEGCDVDPINRIEKATPLHLALRLEDREMRRYIVESLLEAGANIKIKDKNGDTALDVLPASDTEMRAIIRKSQAVASVSRDDIANDDDDEPGSGSGSNEE